MATVWQVLGRALSPVEDRPRIAPELESACYTTRAGAPYVVIHNARAHTYARLDPREFELLPLMDGRRSVKELVIAYYQRHGVLALARVAGLVHLLRQQHFLSCAPDSYARLTRAVRGSHTQFPSGELTTSDVDAVLSQAYRMWGRFFFQRQWLYIGLGLGALSPLLVGLELAQGRYALYDVGGWGALTIVVLLALTLIALAIHEVGHGLAVKHAGRRVNQAGIRLYFGLPAAFVDTTDVWMAPPRQRLLTAFAGPWTGLVLGGGCAIAAALVSTSPVGAFLFTAAFVFLVDNLFNFNPLLELDGYYMLIDFLDRPLLRARAMAFVRGPLWRRVWRHEALSAEERWLAGFGVAAALYTAFAAVLAVRAWQALLVPVIAGSLSSGDLPRQVIGVLLLAAIV